MKPSTSANRAAACVTLVTMESVCVCLSVFERVRKDVEDVCFKTLHHQDSHCTDLQTFNYIIIPDPLIFLPIFH